MARNLHVGVSCSVEGMGSFGKPAVHDDEYRVSDEPSFENQSLQNLSHSPQMLESGIGTAFELLTPMAPTNLR